MRTDEALDIGAAAAFDTPPVLTNYEGKTRRAGFEFEFAGLSIFRSALLVRDVFGGDHVVKSTFVHEVRSHLGTFNVEIDTSLLKDKRYETALRAIGVDLNKLHVKWLENALLGLAAAIIPTEISTPPLTITDLAPLETLRHLLHENSAKGTRARLFYAFGMHINPELPSNDPVDIWNVLRAFLLLYPWLKQRTQVDLTRSLAPYINPFPVAYAKLVMRDDYPATRERLIDDYLRFNPTRNRALDLLPVLAWLDEERVLQRVEEKHLVKPRPAYHYRLPNCMLDEPDWRLAREWNTWVAVERLARDRDKLRAMSQDYLEADERSLKPFYDRWPGVLEQYVRP
jgi:hypothetical protein